MTKSLTILSLCVGLLATTSAFSQKIFQQSIGFAYLSVQNQQQSFRYQPFQRAAYDVLTPKRFTSYGTVNYYPRFNVKSWGQSGLSVGAPIAISAFASFSTSDFPGQEKENYLILSLPITAEWAWGYRAQRDLLDKTLGFYVNGGAALTLGSGLVGDFSNVNPYLGGGLRLKISERIGLELAYGQNFISILELEGGTLFEELQPPNYEEYGVSYPNEQDRRGTKMFQIGLSFH